MRLKPDEVDFAKYLLDLGNGTTPVHPEIGEGMVKVPQEYLVNSTDDPIDKIFPQLERGYMDKYFISHRAILIPMNDNVESAQRSNHWQSFLEKVKLTCLLIVLLMKIWLTHMQLISSILSLCLACLLML